MATAMPRLKVAGAAAGGPGLRAIAAAAVLHAGILGVVGLLGPWQVSVPPQAATATVTLSLDNPEPVMEAVEPSTPEIEAAVPVGEAAEASTVEPLPLQTLLPEMPLEPQPDVPTVVARPFEPRPSPPPPPRPPREAAASPPSARPQSGATPAAPPSAPSGGSMGQPAPGPPPQAYVSGLLAHLERRREYPPAARLRREEGRVLLRLEIAADGGLRSSSIEQSSGSQILDAAALALARGAAPYPPPPPSAVLRPFLVPIRYNLAR
jgi:protein TonB